MNKFENTDGIDNQEFARSQYQFLKDMKLGDRMQLSRIFKAAGPGQVQEAYKLSTSEPWTNSPYRRNLLLMILIGSSRLRLERRTTEEFLATNNFYVPTAKNDNCFYRVLRGASEMLHPGSYHFSYSDLQQIKDGLKKRVHGENDNVEDSGDREDCNYED